MIPGLGVVVWLEQGVAGGVRRMDSVPNGRGLGFLGGGAGE